VKTVHIPAKKGPPIILYADLRHYSSYGTFRAFREGASDPAACQAHAGSNCVPVHADGLREHEETSCVSPKRHL